MKKLFLSLLALVAMVVTANAQRAWAYDLSLTSEGTAYTFTFKAANAGNATLVFYKNEVEVGTLDLGSVNAGINSTSKRIIELLDIIEEGDYTWGVKISGAAIALSGSYLTELTAAGQGLDFYLPQGLVVDNNPESETFSSLFIAEAQGGTLSVGPTHTQGIYHYSQTLEELNPVDKGIIPSNVTLTNGSRQEMHRIAINPKNNYVAFAHNISGKPAVWSVPANNLGGEATNLIEGTSITMPNSICFDEKGALYVMDNANATTGGTLYKVVDGVATKVAQNMTWQQVDNSLAYDGRGGVWIAQTSTGTTWPSYAILSHVNSDGEIDWSALDHSSEGLFSAGNSYGYSQRGQCAYNAKEGLLVLGGNCRSHIFQVTYDAETGVPSLSLKYRTPYLNAKTNIDGAAFDYAGDLYLMSAARERLYKYVVPTENNTCVTPAPKAQILTLEAPVATAYTITANTNNENMGSVDGAGTYYEGETVTLTATANKGHEFVNWTIGETAYTENPLTLTANEDINVIANFAVLSYTVNVVSCDEEKGVVSEGGVYEYGTEITLTATPAADSRFIRWSNGQTANPLTYIVEDNATLTAIFELHAPEGMAGAPRTWANDLQLTSSGSSYTFAFNVVSKGNATLLFTNEEGEEVGTIDLGVVEAGTYEQTLDKAALPDGDNLNWAVKMSHKSISSVVEVTDQSRNDYQFYATSSVLVDNNPESEHFGKVYVQMVLDGEDDGSTDRTKSQKAGLFMFDQRLNSLNPIDNVGIRPTVPDGYLFGTSRDHFRRLAIDPKTGNLTYCYSVSGTPAVFSMDSDNPTDEVTNLLAGINGFTRPVAHCFDAEGALYVMDLPSAGTIYKIVDGVATVFSATTAKWVQPYISMAADGKGGLWVAQYRGQIDAYYQLAHVTNTGEIDWSVYNNTTTEHNFTGHSYRGGMAYDIERQILAVSRNALVELHSVSYALETGVPTLTKIAETPYIEQNIEGLAFDYAGDLYVVNSSGEKFQKFAIPTNDNTCTTPAPKSQVIVKAEVGAYIDNTTVAPQVQKIVRDGQVLIIRDGKTFNMMGQEVR